MPIMGEEAGMGTCVLDVQRSTESWGVTDAKLGEL